MLSCSRSMNSQALASPNIWIQAETWKYPVPDDAGCGMVSLPLKRGSVRSNHEAGLARPSLAASTVLKHTAATQASMPTQAGGVAGSRKAGLSFGGVFGAHGRGE